MHDYLLTLNVSRGEYSFKCRLVLQARHQESAEVKAGRAASTFYSEKPVKLGESGSYCFNGGEIAVEVSDLQYIPPGKLAVLREFRVC